MSAAAMSCKGRPPRYMLGRRQRFLRDVDPGPISTPRQPQSVSRPHPMSRARAGGPPRTGEAIPL
jgi:hypothetical protein